MPEHLEAWWRAHPERWSQRPRISRGFPADGTQGQQIDWFRRRFLKLADKASSTKERGDLLKLAFMPTLRGESAFAADEQSALAQEQMERVHQKIEEGRARYQAEASKADEKGGYKKSLRLEDSERAHNLRRKLANRDFRIISAALAAIWSDARFLCRA
jgi:hypothetical protein